MPYEVSSYDHVMLFGVMFFFYLDYKSPVNLTKEISINQQSTFLNVNLAIFRKKSCVGIFFSYDFKSLMKLYHYIAYVYNYYYNILHIYMMYMKSTAVCDVNDVKTQPPSENKKSKNT